MMKKALFAIIVSFIAAFALAAAEADVTWVWFENDPNVQFYRYQIDGEEDDKWTVVDFLVSEVTVTLDVSVLHTLYLQQSYDGLHWSASSATESEVYPDYEETVEDNFFDDDFFNDFEDLAEPEVVESQEEEDDVVFDATVIEDEEIVLPEVEVETYEPKVYLDLGLGYMNSIPDSAGPKTAGFNAAYSRTFLKAGIFDIGMKADLGIYTSKDLFNFKQWKDGQWLENWTLRSYVNCLALATTVVGNCDLYGAIGPDFSYTFAKAEERRSALVGLALEFGIRYHRFEKLSIGFAAVDHQYLFSVSGRGLDVSNTFELKAFLGLSL